MNLSDSYSLVAWQKRGQYVATAQCFIENGNGSILENLEGGKSLKKNDIMLAKPKGTQTSLT